MPQKRTVFVVLSIAFSIAILLVLIGLFVYPGWIKIRRAADDDDDDNAEQPTGPTDIDFLQKIADEDVDTIAQVAEAVKRAEDARKILEGQELINYKLLCAPSADEKSGKQPMCTRALRASGSSIAGCWADCMAEYWESCNRKADKTSCLWNIYGAVARNETGAQNGLVTLETEPRKTQVNSVANYFETKVTKRAAIDAAAFGNLKFRTKAPFVTPKQVWDATRPSLGVKSCPAYKVTGQRNTPNQGLIGGLIGGRILGNFPANYTISVGPSGDECTVSLGMTAGGYSAGERCGDNFPGYETLSTKPWSSGETYSAKCTEDIFYEVGKNINNQWVQAQPTGGEGLS